MGPIMNLVRKIIIESDKDIYYYQEKNMQKFLSGLKVTLHNTIRYEGFE